MQRATPPSIKAPAVNGAQAVNGSQTNGYFSPPESPSVFRYGGSTRGSTKMRTSMTFSGSRSQKTAVVRDTAISLKRKSIAELGAGISDTADKVTFIELVEWIRAERLSTLPHKGSKWDTVLIRALYFTERLHGFEKALKGHALDNEPAAHLGYGHTRLLLELGHENSDALYKAFAFLYQCSSSVSSLLARSEVLSLSSEIYEQLCTIYTDLLTLLVDVSLRFYKTVHGSSGDAASLDMHEAFGDTIGGFRRRCEEINQAIWQDQINEEDLEAEDIVEVSALNRWLAPQDRVLASVELDHTLISDEMAEFTCVWIYDDLAKFVKSEDDALLINGPAGSGKSTLAASLAERLQRPVGRKSYGTAFYSVGAVPSQATSLNVVKGLLHQLLSIRVGNLHLYNALARAYQHARFTADPTKYEDLLWHALEDALRNPLDRSRETVLIVEGLDELVGGPSAGQGLLQRLVHAVHQGKGVKLVALSEALSLPTGSHGVQRSITHDDTHDDVHEVAMKVLIHCSHFRGKGGRDQEGIIGRVIEASNGSFLWAILTSEVLRLEKTSDSFTKAVNSLNPKTTIEELVQKILHTTELSEDAKQILSWLVYAARPLTYHEIENLFAVNPVNGSRSDRRIDIHRTVQSLRPLVTIQEDIVRPRHNVVQTALRSAFKQGKVTTSVKDQTTDILFRLLAYAKLALPEKGEPTLDDTDRSPLDHSFTRHVLLEYVVRYWTWHLQQTPIISQGKDFQIPAELQKVFPDSTLMPVLEWLSWDDQFPGAQEVEVHDLVARLRIKLLSEQHPAVLQSLINTASYYEMMQDVERGSVLYYKISTIGRNVLSVSHPIVVETALRFLRLSHSRVTTSRTEIMTHREQTLLLLISAYERRYGESSDYVIQIKEQLAELYTYINEQDKATEILRILQGDVVETHGKHSDQSRAIDQHLRVSLGKNKGTTLDTYKDGIFAEEEEDQETVTTLDLAQVDSLRRQIDTYLSQNETVKAEQTYIELWQRLAETCRTTLSAEFHQKKIETVQAYSKFLVTQKRQVEATSLHTSLWREYQSHELSYHESIIAKLTESARTLKTFGEFAASLAIFKHVSSYYRNVRKEESSRSFTEIEEEMTQISQQALTTSKQETHSTRTSSSQWDMFHVLITNKSKTIDATTLTLSKQLTSQYISQRNYEQAIAVVHATLERTWSSFLAKSVHEVTMTTTFQKESIELVEQLAECYIAQRSFEKAEDEYVRLFRASLTVSKDVTLLDKAKNLLIGFYTRRGHPDKVIGAYQELLAVYRRTLGPSHDATIAILYELATRCRAHARSHPYWIEYYQQIVTALSKDSQTCHPKAIDAAIVVAESYWEERRYSDAVTAYGMIWTTFVHKHKEFKYFSQETFVRNLYERYYQCLEETKADWEVLRTVTSQYRETTRSVFGASSTIAIEATIALARVTQHSETHIEESLSLYEEASRSASQSKDASSSSLNTSELRQAMISIYKRRVFHSDSKSVSSETLERASSACSQQYAETRQQYGYSHESTLTSLREVSQLYIRQQKTEAAVKELTTATVEIVTKETSSEKMYESAVSLIQTFQACNLMAQCTQLVEELHYQLISKERSSKSTINVTESSSASIFFLATLEYHLRKDLSITFSEIMATLKAQSISYWNFRTLTTSKAGLDKVLIAAAPLRRLLRTWNRTALIGNVEHHCVDLFVQRDAANFQLLSKDSPRHFIIGILDYIGNKKISDFVRVVIVSSNQTVSQLIAKNDFTNAHDVAKMAFSYAQYRNGYRGTRAVARGFGLASQLDGRGENRCPDPELRKKLLQLSNNIIKDIMKICREQKINFAQVQLTELNELIALLGEQKDYDTLESLLNELWNTREAQRAWPSDILLNLGRRLICARYLAGRQIKAIRLCEDIAYNMKRVHGIKHRATLETYDLLAQLYTTTGQYYQREVSRDSAAAGLAADHFKKAILVHEDVLRWLLSDSTGGAIGADDDDDDTAATILAEHGVTHDNEQATSTLSDAQRHELIKHHLHLLKLSYQRLGSWPKPYASYEKLNADLFKTFGEQLKGFEGVEKWQAKGFGAGKAESNEGTFAGSSSWEILTA